MTSVPKIARGLRMGAGLTMAGLLVWAPLNFGSTRPGGPELVTRFCSLAILLWAASLACNRRWPPLPAAAVVGVVLFILAVLPWSLGLYHATPVAAFTQLHFSRVAARWPVSIVWRDPANALPLAVALAAVSLPLMDLARTPAWALGFAIALTATAAAVAVLAFLQDYSQAQGIYWRNDGQMPGNFCGTFFHHTSAGAYFNTAWPLAAALTSLAWDHAARAGNPGRRTAAQSRNGGLRSRWLVALGGIATVLLLAAHGSHVSRFPQVAALLVTPFLIGGLRLRIGRGWWLVPAGAAAAFALIFCMGRAATIAARWQLLFAPATEAGGTVASEAAWPGLMRDDLFVAENPARGGLGDRGEAWRTALRGIADRPLTGHGPANWIGAASTFTVDPFVRTFFQFLQFTHQDVLQSAVEWGVPAALGWWGLLIGGIVAVWRTHRALEPLPRRLGIAAACALTAVLLQSQLDFPLQIPAITLNAVTLAALCWAAAGAVRIPRARNFPA